MAIGSKHHVNYPNPFLGSFLDEGGACAIPEHDSSRRIVIVGDNGYLVRAADENRSGTSR